MSLTMGTGPFGPRPGGHFNFTAERPAHAIYFERSPRRVRGILGGETVVDSRDVKLLHETGILPVWYFPEGDVRAEFLRPSEHHTLCPFKGEASYHTLVVGDQVKENAVWHYPDPLEAVPDLAGHVAFYWSAMDAWYEEDEEVFVHPRDPYHRVDIVPTSRRIVVSVGGERIAETRRANALFETNLPTRWYIPREDVRMDRLTDSNSTSQCPYKGTARYWSVPDAGDVGPDLVWGYDDPIPAAAPIAGQVCFFNERVDIDVDGERQDRPQSPWSQAS